MTICPAELSLPTPTFPVAPDGARLDGNALGQAYHGAVVDFGLTIEALWNDAKAACEKLRAADEPQKVADFLDKAKSRKNSHD
mgnify:CR=1 FL=1